MEFSDLPAVNASLNGLATVCLVSGYFFIRKGNKIAHRRCMIAALVCSAVFLTSYLIYHAKVGSVGFQGQGAIRKVYFTVLITHTVLAALVPFLALLTAWRALRERFDAHRKIARWTLPIWLYVSVTGVVVYGMLYHLNV